MNSRQDIDRAALVGTARAAAWIIAIAVATFFVLQSVNPAYADEYTMTLKGRVASVDSYDKTFSIVGSQGKITLGVDKSTSFTLCERNSSFGSLAPGQDVTVTYHKYEGSLIADAIDIAPVVLACYNQ